MPHPYFILILAYPRYDLTLVIKKMSSHSQPFIRSICFYFDQNHAVHIIKVTIIGLQMHFPRVYFKIKMSHISTLFLKCIKVITHAITSGCCGFVGHFCCCQMLQKKSSKKTKQKCLQSLWKCCRSAGDNILSSQRVIEQLDHGPICSKVL